jgi:hypothetical protein
MRDLGVMREKKKSERRQKRIDEVMKGTPTD